jgi:hypothetical protein
MFSITKDSSSGSDEILKLLVNVHTHHRFRICCQTPTTHMINICDPLQVISVKAQVVTLWWWILCDPKHVGVIFNYMFFNFYTTQILTSTFCIIECISWLIKVTDPVTKLCKPCSYYWGTSVWHVLCLCLCYIEVCSVINCFVFVVVVPFLKSEGAHVDVMEFWNILMKTMLHKQMVLSIAVRS